MENHTEYEATQVCSTFPTQNHFVLLGYLSSAVCITGILANTANVIVLSRPKMRSPVNFLLMIIAIAEMLLQIVYVPKAIYYYILKDPHLYVYYTESLPATYWLYFQISFSLVCHTTAIWHTIAVAMLRWVTLGLKNGKWYSTQRNAYICTAVLTTFSCLLSIPSWMYNKVTKDFVLYPVNETSVDHINKTAYSVYPDAETEDGFNYFLFGILGKILPCVMLTILTILLVIIMSKAEKRRKSLINRGQREESRRHQEHNRTTGMLLAVVIIFLVTELPHGIMIIVLGLDKHFYKVYECIGQLIDLFTLVAFSINFFLYTIMSRQFRITFYALFCKNLQPSRESFHRLSQAVNLVKRPKLNKSSSDTTSSMLQSHDKLNDQLLSPQRPLISEQTTSITACSDVML